MKCFLHEALTHIGYTATTRVIDNTNLARLRGSGKNAVMIAEMEHFPSTYGFRFQCHALNHPNRKAGNERGFYTVESNFIPGRCFNSMEDLNQQAFEWATKRYFNRGVGKSDLILAKAFEHERSFLIPLPPYIKPPYAEHPRHTDQYGHVAFVANYNWVPGTKRDDIIILEFDQTIERAFEYRVTALKPLEGIAARILKNEAYIMPDVVLNEDFQNRKSYLEGFACDDADLLQYDKLLSQEEHG